MKQPGKAKSAVTNDKELWLLLDEVAVLISGTKKKVPNLLEAVFDAQEYISRRRKADARNRRMASGGRHAAINKK